MVATRSVLVFKMSLLLTTALIAMPCPAQPRPPSISGTTRDTAGAPIIGVEITLLRDSDNAIAVRSTRSAAEGAFLFENVARGRTFLRARKLGYKVNVTEFSTDTLKADRLLNLVMRIAPVELAAVEVEGKSPAIQEFEERRRKRGTGRFIDKAELDKRRPASLSEILQYYPGMAVRPTNRIGNQLRVRGCKPSIWIDGVQAYGAELDEVVRPMDVEAMEIDSSWSAVPPQFGDRGGRNCGAILVWTRIR
jgi:hypothetical protein